MKKLLIISIACLLIVFALFGYEYFHQVDNRLQVVFCSVGQGDSILITTPQRKHIMIDGGPDKKVLDCLSRHMPFWERTIDVLLLTHPHADHLVGMHYVVDRYTVRHFLSEKLDNKTVGFHSLLQKIVQQNISQANMYAGNSFKTADGVQVAILGPSRAYLAETSPGGQIGEKAEFASVISKVTYGTFRILFTGDSQAEGLKRALQGQTQLISVLQSPHHGSKTGLSQEVLSLIKPQLVVISVGKNSYGHPSPQTLSLFAQLHIPYLRTDTHGDVVITSDGKSWKVEK